LENKVKYLRRSEKYDMTQEQLANALGITRQHVISIEKGTNISAGLMLKIADFFDEDPRDIFFTSDVVSNLQKSNTA
jgi:putative transcriptional regulator